MENISEEYINIEWKEKWVLDGIEIRSFHVISCRLNCGDVITYGIYAAPKKNQKSPAILHIHGGGQTADIYTLLEWVKEGYACISFDWTGHKEGVNRPCDKITQYPDGFEKEIELIDGGKAFLAIKAARTCISILERCEEVDEKNIGVYGISWGGYIAWIVNALEERLKCAVPIYGIGGLHRAGHIWNYKWVKMNNKRKKLWMENMELTKYVTIQKSPILHINATNDFFGAFDVVSEVIPLVPTKCYIDICPNCDHHFARSSANLIKAFFSKYLKGLGSIASSPECTIEFLTSDRIRILVNIDKNPIELWFSKGTKSHRVRCWEVMKEWKAEENYKYIDLEFTESIWLFVRKYYNGWELSQSSLPVCIGKRIEKKVAHSSAILFEGKQYNGLGIYMGPDMRDAGDSFESYNLRTKGLFTNRDSDNIENLLLRTPATQESKAFEHKESIVIEVYNAKTICLIAKTDRQWIEEETSVVFEALEWSYSCDNVVQGENIIRMNDFKNHSGDSLMDFNLIECFIINCKSMESLKINLRKITWNR